MAGMAAPFPQEGNGKNYGRTSAGRRVAPAARLDGPPPDASRAGREEEGGQGGGEGPEMGWNRRFYLKSR